MATQQEQKPACPPHVLEAIYGKAENKQDAYDESLRRWWDIYAERKMEDETEEYVANSLLYDKYHAPRMSKAPDCVKDATAPRFKGPPTHHHHGHGQGQGHTHAEGGSQQQQAAAAAGAQGAAP